MLANPREESILRMSSPLQPCSRRCVAAACRGACLAAPADARTVPTTSLNERHELRSEAIPHPSTNAASCRGAARPLQFDVAPAGQRLRPRCPTSRSAIRFDLFDRAARLRRLNTRGSVSLGDELHAHATLRHALEGKSSTLGTLLTLGMPRAGRLLATRKSATLKPAAGKRALLARTVSPRMACLGMSSIVGIRATLGTTRSLGCPTPSAASSSCVPRLPNT
jgi:hypothetical protein